MPPFPSRLVRLSALCGMAAPILFGLTGGILLIREEVMAIRLFVLAGQREMAGGGES